MSFNVLHIPLSDYAHCNWPVFIKPLCNWHTTLSVSMENFLCENSFLCFSLLCSERKEKILTGKTRLPDYVKQMMYFKLRGWCKKVGLITVRRGKEFFTFSLLIWLILKRTLKKILVEIL